MENLLVRTLNILKKINKHSEKEEISEKEFSEEEENIKDFIKLKKDFDILLKELEAQETFEDKTWRGDRLVDLHLKLSYAAWHIEQIHELVDKLVNIYGKELLELEQDDHFA